MASLPQGCIDAIQSAETVLVACGMNCPEHLIGALAEARVQMNATVHDLAMPALGVHDGMKLPGSARWLTSFMTPSHKAEGSSATVEHVPVLHSQRLAAIDARLGKGPTVLLVRTCADGRNLGPQADFCADLAERADIVIAEVHRDLAPARDGELLPRAPDWSWHCDAPLPEVPAAPVDEISARIGDNVCSLIEDGDCLQVGIGSVAEAIYQTLGSFKDLGIHTGLLGSSIRPWVESGVVNGARKNIDTGKLVTGYFFGDQDDYAWASETLRFRPVSYTHSPASIAQLDNFVAINSTLEVDLRGQANSEFAKGRRISAVGGFADYLRGAQFSKGGRSIIALGATTRSGASRIVTRMGEPGVATAMAQDTDHIVTEFGVASLKGLSESERARALIEIAAPEHREALEKEAFAGK